MKPKNNPLHRAGVLAILCVCIASFSSVPAAAETETIHSQIDLSEIIKTSGGNFMIIGNSYEGYRVFNATSQKPDLAEVHAETFQQDTCALEGQRQASLNLPATAASGYYYQLVKTTGSNYQQATVGEQLPSPLELTVLNESGNSLADVPVTCTVIKGGGNFTGGSTTLTVQSDAGGKVSTALVVGTDTSANPIGWQEEGKNTQQVGLNVVECAPAAEPGIRTAFYAYGFPDEPVEIRYHDDITNPSSLHFDVINCVGFFHISVHDQYGNIVSNVPINISTGATATIELTVCTEYPNHDTRPALVVPMEALEATFPDYTYERFTSYSDQTLVIDSDYVPVLFTAFTGGLTNTLYDINFTASSAARTLTIETVNRDNFNGYKTFGNCDGTAPPDSKVYWYAFGKANGWHKPGDTVDITFGLYKLKESGEELGLCGSCQDIIGGTEYYIGSTLQDVTLQINGTPISAGGSTPYSPVFLMQLNVPESSSYLDMRFDYRRELNNRAYTDDECYCTTSQFYQNYIHRYIWINPLTIEVDPAVVLSINDTGRNLCDTRIAYSLQPTSYHPKFAGLTVFENGASFAEFPLDTTTLAPVVIPEEMLFDPSKIYTAQVSVDSYGTGEFDGTSSDAVVLTLQTDMSIKHIYVENEAENIPVMPGKSVQFLAETNHL